MKIFLILCACAVVSSAPYSSILEQILKLEELLLKNPEEVKALLEKLIGEHHIGKRLFFHSMVHNIGHALGIPAVVRPLVREPEVALPAVFSTAVVEHPESEVTVGGHDVGHAVNSHSLKEALQNLGHAAGGVVKSTNTGVEIVGQAVGDPTQGFGTTVTDHRQAAADLLHGINQVCHYVVQAAGDLHRDAQTGLQCVPVVGQTAAAVVQVYLATLQATGALEQPSEEECREVILQFISVQGE